MLPGFVVQEFQLRVVPIDYSNFALELYQCAYKQAGEKRRPAQASWAAEGTIFGTSTASGL